MAKTIAIGGKGGSGKTTIAAMIVRLLLKRGGRGAILAVDADPNSCLGSMLGVQPVGTIADIREDARAKAPANAGTDRLRSLEYDIQKALTEADGFDLLVMGRPEGPGCYCAVNNILRQFLDKLSSQYEYVIIDNEAGMEHLSRRTTNNVDILCIVTEPTSLGVDTANRIFELAKKLPVSIKETGVIWNKINQGSGVRDRGAVVNGQESEVRSQKSGVWDQLEEIEVFGSVPYDRAVFDASMQGKTVFDIDENSPSLLAVSKICNVILSAVKNLSF
jgi:CO dehydrogenase maturation factor